MRLLKYLGGGMLLGLGLGIASAGIDYANSYSSKKSELEKLNKTIALTKEEGTGLEKQISEYDGGKAIKLAESQIFEKSNQYAATTLNYNNALTDVQTIDGKITDTAKSLADILEQYNAQKTNYDSAKQENDILTNELGEIEDKLSALEQEAADAKAEYESAMLSMMEENVANKEKLEKEYSAKIAAEQEKIAQYEEQIREGLVRDAYKLLELDELGKPLGGWTKKELDKKAAGFADYLTKQGLETDLAGAIEYWSVLCSEDGTSAFEYLDIVYGKDNEFARHFDEYRPEYQDARTKQQLWLVNRVLAYYENWGNEEIKKAKAENKGKIEDRVFKDAVWHAGRRNPNGSGSVSISDAIKQIELAHKLNDKEGGYYEQAISNAKKVIFEEIKYKIENSDSALNEFWQGFGSAFSLGVVPSDSSLQNLRRDYILAEPFLTEKQKNALEEILARKLEQLEKNREESKGILGSIVNVVATPVRIIPVVGPAVTNAAEDIVDAPQRIIAGNAYSRGRSFGVAALVGIRNAIATKGKEAVEEPLNGIFNGQKGGGGFGGQ